MPNLHGLFDGLPGSAALEVAGALAVAASVWLAGRRTSFVIGLAATLTGGLLLSYHSYLSDCAVLLPAATAVYTVAPRAVRLVAVLLLVPFPYFLLIAPRPGPYFVQLLIVALFVGNVLLARRGDSAEPVPAAA
jgi:hypothetical protein